MWSAGYSAGWTVDALAREAERLGLTVVDIRYRPWSSQRSWCRDRLEALLGHRYVWLEALGNVSYQDRGSPIELDDLEAGLTALRAMLAEEKVPLLLCACSVQEKCHRALVIRLMGDLGIETRELEVQGRLPFA